VKKNFKPILFVKSDLNICSYQLYLCCAGGNYACGELTDEGLVIKVGVICKFPELVGNILHELNESYLLKEGCRYYNTKSVDEPQQDCAFFVPHKIFQDMNIVIGNEITNMLPTLYNKWSELNISKEDKVVEVKKKRKTSKK